jgi:hypothetical protein
MNKLFLSAISLLFLFSVLSCTTTTDSFFTAGTFELDTKTKTASATTSYASSGYYKIEFGTDTIKETYIPGSSINTSTGSYSTVGYATVTYTIDKNLNKALNLTSFTEVSAGSTIKKTTYTVYYNKIVSTVTGSATSTTEYLAGTIHTATFDFYYEPSRGYYIDGNYTVNGSVSNPTTGTYLYLIK